MDYQIFVSWTGKDIEIKNEVVQCFKNAGFGVWESDSQTTNAFSEACVKALKTSHGFVCIVSEDSMKPSSYVSEEIRIARDRNTQGLLDVVPFKVTKKPYTDTFDFFIGGFSGIFGDLPTTPQMLDQLIKKVELLAQKRLSGNPEAPLSPVKPRIINANIGTPNYFIGRTHELQRIHEILHEQKRNIVFLHGIGGIGKTELAKKYVSTYQGYYNQRHLVFFSQSLQHMISSLEFENINISKEGLSEEEYYYKKYQLLLKSDSNTILVIDNFNGQYDSRYADLEALPCKFIFTTRSEIEYAPCVNVSPIDESGMIQLFSYHYGMPILQGNKDVVEEMIALVSRHTLTVELIAKTMKMGRISPAKMLETLKTDPKNVTQRINIIKDRSSHYDTIYRYLLSLFDLSQLERVHLEILSVLSLMPSSGVQYETLLRYTQKEDYNEINDLVMSGWIQDDRERMTFSLHPLIELIVQHEVKDTEVLFEQLLIRLIQDTLLASTFSPQQRGIQIELSRSVLSKRQHDHEYIQSLKFTLLYLTIIDGRVREADRLFDDWISHFHGNDQEGTPWIAFASLLMMSVYGQLGKKEKINQLLQRIQEIASHLDELPQLYLKQQMFAFMANMGLDYEAVLGDDIADFIEILQFNDVAKEYGKTRFLHEFFALIPVEEAFWNHEDLMSMFIPQNDAFRNHMIETLRQIEQSGEFVNQAEYHLSMMDQLEMTLSTLIEMKKPLLSAMSQVISLLELYSLTHSYDRCFSFILSILPSIIQELTEQHPSVSAIYANLAYMASMKKNDELVIEYALKSLAIYEKNQITVSDDMLSVLKHLAISYANQGLFETSLSYFERLIATVETLFEHDPSRLLNHSVFYLGQYFPYDPDVYLAAFRIALHRSKARKDYPLVHQLYVKTKKYFDEKGLVREWLDYVQEHIQYLAENHLDQTPMYAYAMQSMAGYYIKKHDMEQARPYFETSLNLVNPKTWEPYERYLLYQNYAIHFLNSSMYKNVSTFALEAIKVANSWVEKIESFNALGSAAIRLAKKQEIVDVYLEFFTDIDFDAIEEETEDEEQLESIFKLLINVYGFLSSAYQGLGQIKETVSAYQKGIELYKRLERYIDALQLHQQVVHLFMTGKDHEGFEAAIQAVFDDEEIMEHVRDEAIKFKQYRIAYYNNLRKQYPRGTDEYLEYLDLTIAAYEDPEVNHYTYNYLQFRLEKAFCLREQNAVSEMISQLEDLLDVSKQVNHIEKAALVEKMVEWLVEGYTTLGDTQSLEEILKRKSNI